MSRRWKGTKKKPTSIALHLVVPSISIGLLNAALQFATSYVSDITDEEQYIILHDRNSLFDHTGESWRKKTSSDLFDITMGAFDCAKSSELVGAYLLYNIKEKK